MMTLSIENLHKQSRRRLQRNARVVYAAAAAGLRPDPSERVSEWAAGHRIVPDIGALPGPWRNETAPYLIEPMDALSPDDPCENVVVMGPAQGGKSAIAENWLGFIMHRAPGPAMYVGPTVKAAKDWFQEKLGPTIDATPALSPALNGVVEPTRSRSGEGSTSERIRFRGGYLLLAGANSAATLRQHSIRYMVRDDRSAWTDNADNEGDPKDLSDKRLKTYRVFGMAKCLDVSSPKLKGADIDADYEAGDRRRYYVACKTCLSLNDFDWEDIRKNETPPYRCHLICPNCGAEHFEADKAAMTARENGACWIPTAPDANGEVPPKTIAPADVDHWRNRHTGRRIRSYAITGLVNIFDKWELLAAGEAAAGDDPDKQQPFQNGDLGRPYEPKGEGPGWELLAARRESEWSRGHAPAGVLYVTLTADVQADGLYWSYLGWGPRKECWHLDYGFLPGATDVPLEGAWPKLDFIADRGVRFGGVRVGPDMIAVDSAYNAEPVYSWTKRRHNALNVRGVDGWSKLPIFRAENPEVRKHGLSAGKARRFGARVWLIGTYGIKGAMMVYLAREAKEGGAQLPTGYQHFPSDAGEGDEYFRHLVSEYIKTVTSNYGAVRKWEAKGPNHWLDCLVYGYALTHYVGLWAWDEDAWERRAAEIAEMTKARQSDLFHPEVATAGMVGAVQSADEAENDPPAIKPAEPVVVKKRDTSALDRLAALNQ